MIGPGHSPVKEIETAEPAFSGVWGSERHPHQERIVDAQLRRSVVGGTRPFSPGGRRQRLIAPAPSCDHQIQCKCDEDAMLDLANDIRSLSEFKRNTVDLLDRLRRTGHPLVLTINGKAELVVQDAGAYQALLDRVEAIEGIQRGLADVKAGRTRPARQVFTRLRRKHGIPR